VPALSTEDLRELRDRAIRALRLAIRIGDETRVVAAVDAILEAAVAMAEEKVTSMLSEDRPTEPPPPVR